MSFIRVTTDTVANRRTTLLICKKHSRYYIIIFIYLFLSILFTRSPCTLAADDAADTTSVIIYFYVSPCSSCDAVSKYLDTLDNQYTLSLEGREISSELSIVKINYSDHDNFTLSAKYFLAYRVPPNAQAAPIILIGESYLQGEEDIQNQLEGMITAGYGLSTKMPEEILQQQGKPVPTQDYLSGYKAPGVFLTGLINGFNPCSLAILLFFLSMLVARKESILKLGFSFIAGKFITYIALGTLLYGLFSKVGGQWYDNASLVIKIILLAVALFLVIMFVRDFFAAKNEAYDKVKMQLPTGFRRFNHGMIKRMSKIKNNKLLIPLCFGLGVFISIGEFLCTGQMYLATIIFVFKNSEAFNIEAITYFLIYGVAFIIPLVIITLVIHRGKEVFDISEIVRGKLHIIKLVNAFIFLVFALIVLFFF